MWLQVVVRKRGLDALSRGTMHAAYTCNLGRHALQEYASPTPCVPALWDNHTFRNDTRGEPLHKRRDRTLSVAYGSRFPAELAELERYDILVASDLFSAQGGIISYESWRRTLSPGTVPGQIIQRPGIGRNILL